MSFSFPSAKTHLRLHRSGEHGEQWQTLKRRVSEHHFNHAVEILWPNVARLPPELEDLTPAYHTAHLPLSHFLKSALVKNYASLAALSIDDSIDTGNVYALLPPGKLVMSVDKDTSEELGLDSTPSRFNKHRRVVEVDLLAERFSEGKPSRERLQWCLTERLSLTVDFVLCSSPSGETNLCSDFVAKKCLCQRVTRVLDGVSVPVLHHGNPTGSLESGEKACSGAGEVCTWMGAISCDAVSCQDSYISTYAPPDPAVTCHSTVISQWRGMIHADHICSILTSMRDHITGDSWAALSVWGFDDSPTSWSTNEHGYYVSGDNNYTVFLFGSGQYWFVPVLGAYDIIP